ncbi:MAG TPA: S-methyl-5-thioribose-1-phosphate isomerase [Bacillota bacterium]|nr:S-methyl-5-thioribose-1-phosphate isomerase [Bacillota bacterium]
MQTVKETLWYDSESNSLVIIDQTKLPGQLAMLSITTPRQLYDAIKTLAVRGAPAIGVSAAIGTAVIASRMDKTPDFIRDFSDMCNYIDSSRPTAVNLSWALGKMKSVLDVSLSQQENVKRLFAEAKSIRDCDVAMCYAIGRHGSTLISDGDTVMTHCNAGRLAAVMYGTALAPIYCAYEQGKHISVRCDETRPLLQGARLTAWELANDGIPVSVQCDSMAAMLMASGKINSVFVGCDRCAANGDFANKIGTYSLAVIAHEFGVPFYVCLPSSTVDMDTPDGTGIPVEFRDGSEIGEKWYSQSMTLPGVGYYNPAFDVTPERYVTAYITENGVFAHIGGEC